MSNTGKKQRGKPVKKINYNMKKKLVILFSLVLLALVALTLRITYINATSGSRYKKQVLSQAQQKYESQTLPAKRGDIYDKNGNILATSNKVYNVILDCKTVNSDEDYVEPTIKALTEVLGLEEEKIRSLLSDSEFFAPHPENDESTRIPARNNAVLFIIFSPRLIFFLLTITYLQSIH